MRIIAALALTWIIVTAPGVAIIWAHGNQARRTVTVVIYHGRTGTSGLEGVTTCHGEDTTNHGKLATYHDCSPIHH